MPPFLLIVFLVSSVSLLIKVFVLTPLQTLHGLSLPGWLFWSLVAGVVFWCFGE